MPLAPNVLLQVSAATTARASAASSSLKPADAGNDEASSFSGVYARQAQDASRTNNDVPARPARDKAAPEKDKPVASKDKPESDAKPAADGGKVADSGNDLPAKAPVADKESAEDQQGEQLADTTLPVTADPVLDPALLVTTPVTTAVPEVPVEALPVDVEAQPALPVVAQVVTPPVTTPVAQAVDESFDPEADPLDGLHALQFALENANGRSQRTGQAASTADKAAKVTTTTGEADPSQNVVNNPAMLSDQLTLEEGTTEGGDKAFSGLLSDGLKDVKSAVGDTRIDNFADRLAAISQAAQQPKAATASPVPLLNQPLAMHQSGWSEGIVDRVMYLSSQNLKSAEIKLEPAELGRLDIRVNMAPDQQTQVTFMSAHVGVREALEGQVSRLRESFNQQGLGQVDVNVSDQSQQQAQQQAQEQAARAQRGGRGGSGSGSGLDDAHDAVQPEAAVAASQPAARVIGSSEIDYYA